MPARCCYFISTYLSLISNTFCEWISGSGYVSLFGFIFVKFGFRFFVISGFLMAQNLSKSKLVTVQDFFIFYYRRFRRILPLYYLVIFVTLAAVHLYLGDFWWYTNRRYSLASLFLVTNQLIIHDSADYFREV